jgi:pilus assembly protein CpaB
MMISGVNRSGALIGVGVAIGLGLIIYGAQRLAPAKPAPAPAASSPERAAVAVAARQIPRGHRLEAADVVFRDLESPPAGAIRAPETAVGRIAAFDIPAQQPIIASALSATPGGAGLAALVPVGYRAISIDTTDEIAVSNLLRPGDVVDVQFVLGDAVLSKGNSGATADRSEASTLLQAVRVVSVGDLVEPAARQGEQGRDRAPPRRTMTLAMTPEQVARFTLARSLGRFYLALRNPDDKAAAPQALARLPDIRPAAPAAARSAPARRTRAAAPQGVELVVAGQSQTIFPQ